MRSIRAVAAVVAALLLGAACTGPGGLGGPGVGDVALRQADVPHGFQRCPYSGAIDAYVRRMRTRDATAAREADTSWAQARSRGAQAADVTAYAARPDGCRVGLGRSVDASIATWVVQARDEGSADAVYRNGLLGFTTPPGQPEDAAVVVGAATALGQHAWTLRLATPAPGIYAACWQDRDFVVLLLAVGVPAQTAHQAAVRVDERIA